MEIRPLDVDIVDAISPYVLSNMKRICALLCSLFIGSYAFANTITFEGRSNEAVFTTGEFLHVDGYDFALHNILGGFIVITSQSNIVESGTTKLTTGNYAEITMSKYGGGAFDLLGFDLGGSFTDPGLGFYWASAVTVTGTFAAGGSLSQAVALHTTPDYRHVTLTGFTGLSDVLFSPLPNIDSDQWTNPWRRNFSLDNLNVQASKVPDSSDTAALLSIAIVGIVSVRRFRRRLGAAAV
jgi:hypothetical protein